MAIKSAHTFDFQGVYGDSERRLGMMRMSAGEATVAALRVASEMPTRRPADDLDAIDGTIEDVRSAFHRLQESDGHWLYELEADTTIPSEYVMLEHYLDEIDEDLERKIGV